MNLKTGGKLTGNSIMHFHRFLSSALTYAVRMNMIRDNPARRTQPPKVKTKEAAFLSEEEAANMINALTGEDIQFRTMLTLLLYGGMRKGELHGLKWTDLDFETGVLHIERELQYLQKNGLHVRPPKNESSIRWIKLSAGVLEVLRQYHTWQIEERLKVGDQWNDEDWIFTSWNGKPRHPDGLPKLLKAFLKKHGFRSNISLHSFRHSNASFLIAAGVDLRTVSKRLGHAQMSTTANIYSHQIRSADEAAAVALDLIIGGSSPQIVPQVSR
jgi:integrase